MLISERERRLEYLDMLRQQLQREIAALRELQSFGLRMAKVNPVTPE